MNAYEANGFCDRDEYLRFLADDFGCDLEIVYEAAELLGPDEDFDGLVSTLDDYLSGRGF